MLSLLTNAIDVLEEARFFVMKARHHLPGEGGAARGAGRGGTRMRRNKGFPAAQGMRLREKERHLVPVMEVLAKICPGRFRQTGMRRQPCRFFLA